MELKEHLEILSKENLISLLMDLSDTNTGVRNYLTEKQNAFFQGYLAACDNGFRDYKSVFSLTYTWIEWLEYNIQRALGTSYDKAEQEMGLTEVRNTIKRIKYIHQMEDRIKQNLQSLHQ